MNEKGHFQPDNWATNEELNATSDRVSYTIRPDLQRFLESADFPIKRHQVTSFPDI